MPRRCTICDHRQRKAIDRALANGAPWGELVSVYTVSNSALRRHAAKHLPAAMVLANGAAEAAHGDDLLRQARDLQAKALSILAQAEAAGELRTAVAANREARGCLELLARLLGELNGAAQVNVAVDVAVTTGPALDYSRLTVAELAVFGNLHAIACGTVEAYDVAFVHHFRELYAKAAGVSPNTLN